jgi:hypothetical protein
MEILSVEDKNVYGHVPNTKGKGDASKPNGSYPSTLLTGETVHPSTGRVEPVRGCLNNPSRLVWTTLTSLTAPLATLRSRKETKEKVDLS